MAVESALLSSRFQLSIAIVLLVVVALPSLPVRVARAAGVDVPNVGVWNDDCNSANMTQASPFCTAVGQSFCGCNYLSPGTQLTIDINVTNAPLFNAYQFSIFYDPTNLTLSSYNVGQSNIPGESPIFNNPFIANPGGAFDNLTTPGAVRAEVVNLPSVSGNGTVYGSGVLAYLTFNIKGYGVSPFVMAAGTCCPAEGGGATLDDWTRLVLGRNLIGVTTSDGYFQNNSAKRGPVAKFTISPISPIQGQPVMFNATSSFDPDNSTGRGIRSYSWDFGDGSSETAGAVVAHVFAVPGLLFVGNFSVLLTVTDFDNHFEGMVTKLVDIFPPVPPPPPCPSGFLTARVPQDCPTVQSAIDSVVRGGTVQVSQGSYKESLAITKTLKLIGTGDNQTILDGGIFIGASNVTIEGFRIVNTAPTRGIDVEYSPNVFIFENQIMGQNSSSGAPPFGLRVFMSRNATLIGNMVANEKSGISLESSPGSTLRSNSMVQNLYNFGVYGSYVQYIDTSNTVNGRPILYDTQNDISRLPSNPGYLGVVNSHDLQVSSALVENVGQGLLILNSTRITVTGLKAREVQTGAIVLNSTSIVLHGNAMESCGSLDFQFTVNSNFSRNTFACDYGLTLYKCSRNVIANDTITSTGSHDPNAPAVLLLDSPMNQFASNNITGFRPNGFPRSPGLNIIQSSFNEFTANKILGGVIIDNSQAEELKLNSISSGYPDFAIFSAHYECVFENIPCYLLSDYVQDIDPSNTIEGKPIYYLVNRNDVVVPSTAGLVASINSTNVSVKNVNISNEYQDVISVSSTNFSVKDSNLTFAAEGIFVQSTLGLTIGNNHFSAEYGGIRIGSSKNGLISGNDIEGVTDGVLLDNSTAFTVEGNYFTNYRDYGLRSNLSFNSQIISNTFAGFLSPRGLGPTGLFAPSNSLIVGNTFAHNYFGLTADHSTIYQNNFIDNIIQATGTSDTWNNGSGQGNYWTDYAGQDLNGDGVGDTLLPHLGFDNYPLMSPWIPTGLGAGFSGRAAWPDAKRFVISTTNGGILSLNAQVTNKGTTPEWVRAVFNITSSNGTTIQLVSQRVWLNPGAQIILTASFSPPPGSYQVTVVLSFSSDAYLKWTIGSARAFFFKAVP